MKRWSGLSVSRSTPIAWLGQLLSQFADAYTRSIEALGVQSANNSIERRDLVSSALTAMNPDVRRHALLKAE